LGATSLGLYFFVAEKNVSEVQEATNKAG